MIPSDPMRARRARVYRQAHPVEPRCICSSPICPKEHSLTVREIARRIGAR